MQRSQLIVAILAIALPTGASASAPAMPVDFAICKVCHSVVANEKARIGPNLFGVVGRKAGVAPGYAYSAPMKASGIIWSKQALARFVANPAGTVAGTRMAYPGQKDARKAAAIVDYLAELK